MILPDPRLLGSPTPSPAPAGEGRGPRGASNHRALWLLAAALLCPSIAPQAAGADPFADEVVSFEPGERAGFDLDAIAAVHHCDTPPPAATATPSGSPTPTADGPTPTPSSTRRTTPTATPTRTAKPATPVETALRGDANGDGVVDALDIDHAIAEIFDGDGDFAGDAGGGRVASSPGVDRNQDGRISVADLLP